MAPLPENGTIRYWVRYRANGHEHEALFRPSEAAFDGQTQVNIFVARVASLFADIASLLPPDFSFISARWSDAGSTISLPSNVPAGVTGTGAAQPGEAPAFITFVGRSPLGRRYRLHILGVTLSPADDPAWLGDYRIQAGESVQVAAAITNLNGWANLVAIDGTHPNMYGYANVGYNAYWQRAVRG